MRNPELEALLETADDPDSLCLVYADWLQQHGDPLGELIQIQNELIDDPRSLSLRDRETALLDDHAVDLVGPALALRVNLLAWRCGFIRWGRFGLTELTELRARPAGRLLANLTCDVFPSTVQRMIDLLVADPPPLRALHLPGGDQPAVTRRLWKALARLETVTLYRGCFDLRGIGSPALRELFVRQVELTGENVNAIAAGSWPSLERLMLWPCDAAEYQTHRRRGNAARRPTSPIQLADLDGVLTSPRFPALRHFGIRNITFGDELCQALVRSPRAPQLRRLNLSHCAITDAGATLLANRESFAALELIVLAGNPISSAVLDDVGRELGAYSYDELDGFR